MKPEYLTDKITNICIKLFIVSALFLPVLTTNAENPELDGYYSRFILDNFFAFAIIIICIIGWVIHKNFKFDFLKGVILLSLIVTIYGILYYINMDIIQFPWAGWNTVISLLLPICFMLNYNKNIFKNDNLVYFLIGAILISSILAIIAYSKGLLSIHMYNFKLTMTPLDPNYYEKRFNWIYFYKCQYSCLLFLFVSFFVSVKHKFKNKILYGLSLVVLFICLYIAHTNTATACALMVVAADILDYICSNRKYIILKLCPFIVGVLSVVGFIYQKVSQERNIADLGARIPIWKAALNKIKENPHGLGNRFVLNGNDWLQVNEYCKTNNCHNIFLNEMLRFSVPVGCAYVGFYITICLYSLIQKFSFFRLATWIGLFIIISMDYSIQTPELAMVMFMIYCIFFYSLEDESL